MKIVICISTTPNRKEVFEKTLQWWINLAPKNADIKVYSDTEHIGIAASKNKCLAMCEGYSHIFLVDDDIRPMTVNWGKDYVESDLEHAMYIFDRHKLFQNEKYASYILPRGCMLYLTKKVLETAGGFDERFKGYSYEHAEYSRRIFNMGLTPAPYLDIPNSKGLFYSYDEQDANFQSSIDRHTCRENITKNKILFDKTVNSNQFIPYK